MIKKEKILKDNANTNANNKNNSLKMPKKDAPKAVSLLL